MCFPSYPCEASCYKFAIYRWGEGGSKRFSNLLMVTDLRFRTRQSGPILHTFMHSAILKSPASWDPAFCPLWRRLEAEITVVSAVFMEFWNQNFLKPMRTLTLVPHISCVLRSGPSLPCFPSPPHPQPTIHARGRQYFCEEPNNISGSAGHIRSLSHIFLWVCFFFPFILQHLKNLTITLSSQDAQEQVMSCPCSTLLLFIFLWAPFVSSAHPVSGAQVLLSPCHRAFALLFPFYLVGSCL